MPSSAEAPRAEQRRIHEIKVRFSPEELKLVRSDAALAHRFLSEYIRMSVLGQIEPVPTAAKRAA